MRIAFVTSYDSENIENWSGLGFHMAKGLENQGIELIRVNCSVRFPLMQRVLKKILVICCHKKWQLERESSYLRKMANLVTQQLAGREYDIIFCASSLPVSFLKSHKPVVFYTDATYDALMMVYEEPNSICKRSIWQGNLAEQRAIQKASLIFYTSDWAKHNAIVTYNARPEKIKRLPFGSNLPGLRTIDDILILLQQRCLYKNKNFLFIGVDWKRKGAAIAIDTISKLREAGIAATLTIVGPAVPTGLQLPGFVEYYPFISKVEAWGRNKLDELFRTAHFFLLPTEADCTPVVFSEAASYGLPVITTPVGGCRSVVIDEVTGFCIEKETFAEDAVRKLLLLCQNKEKYEAFCLRSFEHYEKELDWKVITQKIKQHLRLLKVSGTNIGWARINNNN